MHRRLRCSAWFVLLAGATQLRDARPVVAEPAPAAAPVLRAGDRVVFYGDSITEQRLYTRYTQLAVYLRQPELDVRWFNAGWGGDTLAGALTRLERDVLPLNPTVVTLCFGMNDGGYRAPDDGVTAAFRARLDQLVARLLEAQVRVVVCTPGCVDPDRNPALGTARYNDALAGLAAAALEVAAARGCVGVDLHGPMLAHQRARKAANPAFTMIPDAVHPDAEGHAVMARELARGLGVADAKPWPTLDLAPGAKAPPPAGVVVTRDGDDATLRLTGPVAMPLWTAPDAARALAAAEAPAGWWPRLVVAGLPEGAYDAEIGDVVLATWTADELTRGVRVPGTWSVHAKELHDLVERKEQQYFETWRVLKPAYEGLEGSDALWTARLAADEAMHGLAKGLVAPTTGVEVRLTRAPGGENLARGKPYVASDANRFGWGTGGLTDGSWEGSAAHCFATGDDPRLPKTVTLDLGSVRKLASVRFGVPSFGSTRTVKVALSKDGKRFDDVGSHEFPQRKAERWTQSFTPLHARYVRLTYADRHPTQVDFAPAFAFTTELEVYPTR